jgi:hypothetical protein
VERTSTISRPLDILNNDSTNPLFRPLIITDITEQPILGTCIIAPNRQTIQYQRPSNTVFTGTVSCTYRVCTNDLLERACDTAVVFINLIANPTKKPTKKPTPSPTRRPTKRPVFIDFPLPAEPTLSPTLNPSKYITICYICLVYIISFVSSNTFHFAKPYYTYYHHQR